MDPFVTGSLIKAGTSILGGLFGARSARKQREQARSDQKRQFERLREAAERGGFNPLTALQSTGGAGFGAGSLPSGAPPLASFEFIRDGISGVADELTGVNAQNRATDRFNRELAELQLEKAKTGTSSLDPSGPFAPRATSTGVSPRSARVPPLSTSVDRSGIADVYNPSALDPGQVVESTLYDDRPQEVIAEENAPLTRQIRTPQGDLVTALNADALEGEIPETLSSIFVGGQILGHNVKRWWDKRTIDKATYDSRSSQVTIHPQRYRVSPTPEQISDWQFRQNVQR